MKAIQLLYETLVVAILMADNFHTYVSTLLRSFALIVLCHRPNRIFLLYLSIRFSQNIEHFHRDEFKTEVQRFEDRRLDERRIFYSVPSTDFSIRR